MLGEAGEFRKAARVIEAAWREHPHPDLAEAYAHLRPGDSARERLARVQSLSAKTPGNVEAGLAVARAALDAQEFAVARQALAPLVTAPTQRVAALMAALEDMEHGDEGRAREWMARALHARRDPAWTADGFVSDRWLPVSPVSGRLDAFAWKDPLAGLDSSDAMIEADKAPAIDWSSEPPIEDKPAEPADAPPRREETSQAEPSHQEPRPRRARSLTPVPVPPAVIPLVHAPDDPGPEPELHIEPEPEPTVELPDSWSRIRQMFKP